MHWRLLRGGPPEPEEDDQPVEVDELDRHPLLSRLVRRETQKCGLSAGGTATVVLLGALLPVLYTITLTAVGTHRYAAFDGCTDAAGIAQPLTTCFACNGNTTVVEVRSQLCCHLMLPLSVGARARGVTRGSAGRIGGRELYRPHARGRAVANHCPGP